MSNQYLPTINSEKVYTPYCTTQGKKDDYHASQKYVCQYIDYKGWEEYDEDSTLYYNVTMKEYIDEIMCSENIIVLKNQIPGGATFVRNVSEEQYRQWLKNVGDEQLRQWINQNKTQMSVLPLPQDDATTIEIVKIMTQRCIDFDTAKMIYNQTSHNNPGPSVSSLSSSLSSNPPSQQCYLSEKELESTAAKDYVEVSVSKIVGPITIGATFDFMAFNKLTKEGILHRKKSNKYYAVSFASTGKEKIPRLLRECTKATIPQYILKNLNDY